MDRHNAPVQGLFERLQGRRVTGVEVESPDWIGVSFDGGDYLSIYADGEALAVGFRRRCPEPLRDERTGKVVRRCMGFADHGGRHT